MTDQERAGDKVLEAVARSLNDLCQHLKLPSNSPHRVVLQLLTTRLEKDRSFHQDLINAVDAERTRNAELECELEKEKFQVGVLTNLTKDHDASELVTRLADRVTSQQAELAAAKWTVEGMAKTIVDQEAQLAARDEKILALAKDHYWDSLESYKEMILLHLAAIVAMK